MKRRITTLVIVLAMLLTLLPTTAFAAESLGIYVGSTEVTTANYQNITGPGISGKVYYDPQTHALVLENATVTSYTDTDTTGEVGGDVAGIVSLWDELTIRLVGSNTVQPNLNGTSVAYCSAVAGLGSLTIDGTDASLTAKAYGAKINVAIASAEELGITAATVYAEAGPSETGSSFGIIANNFTKGSACTLTVISGNCPNGESIALQAGNDIRINGETGSFIAKSGTARTSICVTAGNSVEISANSDIQSGTSTENDSIGVIGDSVKLLGNQKITSGYAEKGCSIVACANKYLSVSGNSFLFTSGDAPNNASAVLYAEGDIDIGTGYTTFTSGTGTSSYCILSNGEVEFTGSRPNFKAGEATDGDSIGVYSHGDVFIMDIIGEIHGGNAPQGYSHAMYSEGRVRFHTQIYNKTVFTGNDGATNCDVSLNVNTLSYWAGNPESTDPVWEMNVSGITPLENAAQYKYLYVVTDDHYMPTPFDDVPSGKFYVDPVLWAVENGITNGVDNLHFAPDQTCNRAQTVTFLWRANGSPEPTVTETPFTDINEKSYYYKAVLWAVENGITNGMTPTTFEPDRTVTRGQVVTFLWRNAGEPATECWENDFTDVHNNSFFSVPVQWAVEKGITTGMTPTTFVPDNGCTRGQIVTFLCRAEGEATDPMQKLIGDWFVYFDGTYNDLLENVRVHSFRLSEDRTVVVDSAYPEGEYLSGYEGTWTATYLGNGRYELLLTVRADQEKFSNEVNDREYQSKLKVNVKDNRMMVTVTEGPSTGAPRNLKVYEKDLTYDAWLEGEGQNYH